MTEESDHIRLILIEGQIKEVSEKMAAQTKATQELVEAWRSAKSLIAVVQVAAKVAGAIGVLWLVVKGIPGHFK